MTLGTNLFILVVGCGRLGSLLANRLSQLGHSVVVIDIDERAFGNLAPEYSGFRIEGDATELAVLKQARVNEADLVITATRDDNINLMVAQVARTEFAVEQVLARVFEPRREAVYRQLGVETICPTSISAEKFLARVCREDSV